jgi:glycosyltransferase involved in cell wall biosynthesis
VADRVRLLGWVDDADLPALYSEALCFVYPSKYEGFGLQLCEAMAVGCPTLAANATCLPEILGAGGETFRIDSSDELSNLLRRICDEEEFRARLSRRASSRSKEFSWHGTAVETMKVYTDIIATA